MPAHLRADPLIGEADPQIVVWFVLTAEVRCHQPTFFLRFIIQKIREFTGCSTRECFTQSAWNLWPYLYDMVLNRSHMWWTNGGSAFYFESYLPKQLAANAGLYERPLENPDPGMTLVDRFICFVKQCLDGVDTK